MVCYLVALVHNACIERAGEERESERIMSEIRMSIFSFQIDLDARVIQVEEEIHSLKNILH